MYLLPSLSHFHSVSDNIPYGVALRLKRICSTEEEFSKKSIEYKNHLLARGYKRKKVKKQFQKANFSLGKLYSPNSLKFLPIRK